MSQPSLTSLLEPSLKKQVPTGALYSAGAHVIVAFFGGAFAVVLFSMWGAKKIHKLKDHLLLFVLTLIASTAMIVFAFWLLRSGWPDILDLGSTEQKSARNFLRIGGMLVCAWLYLGLKEYFRVSEFTGEAPSPWVAGIISAVVGYAVTFIVVTLAVGAGI